MFLRPINLSILILLVYINISIAVMPIFALIYMVICMLGVSPVYVFVDMFMLTTYIIVSLIICIGLYMVIDFLFGITPKLYNKGSLKNYDDMPNLHWIEPIINKLGNAFHISKVDVYIDSSSDGFSVSALRNINKDAIIIQSGVVGALYAYSANSKEMEIAMSGIIAKEMSKLTHGDWIGSSFLFAQSKLVVFINLMFKRICQGIQSVVSAVPVVGSVLKKIIQLYYFICSVIVEFVSEVFIVYIFNFVKAVFSHFALRRNEFETMKAAGNMSLILALCFINISSDDDFENMVRRRQINRMMKNIGSEPITMPNIDIIDMTLAFGAIFLIPACMMYFSKIWLADIFLLHLFDMIVYSLSAFKAEISTFVEEIEALRTAIEHIYNQMVGVKSNAHLTDIAQNANTISGITEKRGNVDIMSSM